MAVIVRNTGPLPFIEREGYVFKPIFTFVEADTKAVPSSKKPTTPDSKSVSCFDIAQLHSKTKVCDTFQKKVARHRRKQRVVEHRVPTGTAPHRINSSAELRPHWTTSLVPYQRLFMHQTLNSVRKHCAYVPYRPVKTELEFVLKSAYEHGLQEFPESSDVYIQPETVGIDTGIMLRNTREIPPILILRRGHPLVYGGITERNNVHSVKIGFSTHHAERSYAGFGRKSNGTFYQF